VLNDADLQAAVEALVEAERTRQPTSRISDRHPEITIEDAYRIQRAVVAAKLKAGRRIRGHKIGLTSRAMQQAAGIGEPDFGHLLDDTVYLDGRSIDVSQFLQPRVEAELAFVLGKQLKGPGVTATDALLATDFIQPALEIIDSRTVTPRKIFDTIADNSALGGLIIGGTPVRPTDVDLRWVGSALYKNGIVEETGLSVAVLGHPANAVAWLANRLADFGVPLEPGHLVLSGSSIRPVVVAKSDVIHADYGVLGAISVSFG
jgi:2-oxo-hept-3-ene-1,7-dioate hydratase